MMGTIIPFDDDQTFEEKVKCLADEELLEIWEESQQLENMLDMHPAFTGNDMPEYERAILNELFVRVGRRLVTPGQP